jgi:hypothetical protein
VFPVVSVAGTAHLCAEDSKRLSKSLLKILRGLFAVCVFLAGTYWFIVSAQGWYQAGFPVLTSGEKGKDPLSGILFSVVFMLYGAWEIVRLVKQGKT